MTTIGQGRTKKQRGFSIVTFLLAIGGLLVCLYLAYSLNVMNPANSDSFGTVRSVPSIKHDALSKQRSIHPMERIVKTKSGPTGTWKLVDWANPITPAEEEKFSCNITTFEAAKSGKQAKMCVHTFNEVITDFVKKDLRWRDCNTLPDFWTADGMEDDDSFFIDIGANIGSCVMEMLLSTKANIIAFEPHPMNVYNIKKTVSQLGKEYQDRLLLFPVGLGSAQSSTTIFSGHDNMGNSQLGTSVKDWETQQFSEHLQFTVFVERMDSLLDAAKISNIKFVKMDCQGFECKTIDGMGAFANKIQTLKFEHSPKMLSAQKCTDLVPRVKKLGLDVYYEGGKGVTRGEKYDEKKTWYSSDLELLAKKSKKL